MSKFGFQPGQGLGANSQGISEPILPVPRVERLGLGHGSLAQLDSTTHSIGFTGHPFFLTHDGPLSADDSNSGYNDTDGTTYSSSSVSSSSVSSSIEALSREYVLHGRPFNAVTVSKWAPLALLRDLYAARQRALDKRLVAVASWRSVRQRTLSSELRLPDGYYSTRSAFLYRYLDVSNRLLASVEDRPEAPSLKFASLVEHEHSDDDGSNNNNNSSSDESGFDEYIAKHLDPTSVVSRSSLLSDTTTQQQQTARVNGIAIGQVSFADAKTMRNTADTQCRHKLLAHLRVALSVLYPGGFLIAHMPDLLDRFSVGLVYVIGQLFDKLRLQKPFLLAPDEPGAILVAMRLRAEPVAAALEFLDHVEQQWESAERQHLTLVQLISMSVLLRDLTFMRWVAAANTRFLKREIESIAYLESELANAASTTTTTSSTHPRKLSTEDALRLLDLAQAQ